MGKKHRWYLLRRSDNEIMDHCDGTVDDAYNLIEKFALQGVDVFPMSSRYLEYLTRNAKTSSTLRAKLSAYNATEEIC